MDWEWGPFQILYLSNISVFCVFRHDYGVRFIFASIKHGHKVACLILIFCVIVLGWRPPKPCCKCPSWISRAAFFFAHPAAAAVTPYIYIPCPLFSWFQTQVGKRGDVMTLFLSFGLFVLLSGRFLWLSLPSSLLFSNCHLLKASTLVHGYKYLLGPSWFLKISLLIPDLLLFCFFFYASEFNQVYGNSWTFSSYLRMKS